MTDCLGSSMARHMTSDVTLSFLDGWLIYSSNWHDWLLRYSKF